MAYITIADIRAEGLSASVPEPRVETAITLWSQFIERACRQFFEARELTVDLDGNDSDTLFLPVPVISVSELFVNSDFETAVPTERYTVYNARGPVNDDRRNPKVKLKRTGNLFSPPSSYGSLGSPAFIKGQRNQRIVGEFGFTESDGSTPALIKRAVAKLVINDCLEQNGTGLAALVEGEPQPGGSIIGETTDGHFVQYGNDNSFKPPRIGTLSITGDPEVDKIIELYKAPIGIAVPGSINWFLG